MGQYYIVVNKTKKQFLNPHTFGEGAKLCEFSFGRGTILTGLSFLLANGNGRGGGDLHSNNELIGSWSGDEISVEGDYADEDYEHEGKPCNLYMLAYETYEDISKATYRVIFEDDWYRQLRREQIEKDNRHMWLPGEHEVLHDEFPELVSKPIKLDSKGHVTDA